MADTPGVGAKLVDPNLRNAWGIAGSSTPLWVADNNTKKVTVYTGGVKGSAVSLFLTVGVPGGHPTGQVFNPTQRFPVGGTAGSPASFIVSTNGTGTSLVGQIEAWNSGSKFVVEDSPAGAVGGKTPAGAIFMGLAITPTSSVGPELFAADVHNARVDIFNKKFARIKAPSEFTDPGIPAGYAPYGIQRLGKQIYVTYGKQDSGKNNVIPGAGLGLVDVFSDNGVLMHHLIGNGPHSRLNEPWGLAIAPSGFGRFAGDLLVGNLGDGRINAFNPTTGQFLGVLKSSGTAITIPGLWGLMPGTGFFGGSGTLAFSAGPSGYAGGLVGTLSPG